MAPVRRGRKVEMEVDVQISEALFMEKELSQLTRLEGFKRGVDFVEVKCGCTSRKYGDSMGTLKVYPNGKFVISCDCTPWCQEDKLTPYEFEKHSQKEGTSKWSHHIWVRIDGKKVPLWRIPLLKYYKHASNGASGSSTRKRHHDEFIKCTNCNKERRFILANEVYRKIYHKALTNKEWVCSDRPYQPITCEDKEERATRKRGGNCPVRSMCKGCLKCVCIGCLSCRFPWCTCRECVDYMKNAEP